MRGGANWAIGEVRAAWTDGSGTRVCNRRTKLMEMRREKAWRGEREVRKKMVIKESVEVYMMSEGSRVDWKDLGSVQADKVVELGLVMRGGGKKKAKTGKQWEILASGGESEETDRTEWRLEDGEYKAVLEEALKKAKEDGGPMDEMIETLAVLGPEERENMFKWDGGSLPQEISEGTKDLGHLHLKWMVEKKIEENQGMLKEEVMRNGMKRGVFRKDHTPDEIIDFGKHVGKTFRQVYVEDPEYCSWAVRQMKPTSTKLNQFKYFVRRMDDLSQKNQGISGEASEVERQLNQLGEHGRRSGGSPGGGATGVE